MRDVPSGEVGVNKVDYALVLLVVVAIAVAIYWQVQVGNELKAGF